MLFAAMDAPRFPLMRLPVACSQNVLCILRLTQLFEISLASKKSKDLVRSLKIKTSEFSLHLYGSYLSIQLRFCSRNEESNLKSYLIYYISYSHEMDERTFLNHLKFIFNTEKITVYFGWNFELFDFKSILEGRQDVESINFLNLNEGEGQRILNIFKPSKIYMYIVTKPRDLMIQNVDDLRANEMNISLEDLLIMNIKNLETRCSMVPAQVLNRFLKLWTRGSNLQLERLELDFQVDGGFTNEEIFNRIKTTQKTTVRYFKLVSGTRKITGGLDISRFDGTMATILLRRLGGFINWIDFEFEILVWHDHCIAKETDR
ncbi:hypothetical protein CAEBREN_23677 [Caenorhabditis brenneri]|uniref:F-box domain-containing protein n=1 Tax=Caenorhabditis brenneri TaxID=135651 RepID=G0N0C3_CAEBE|nr:hypothetical protein CAEBREN_23677 [Caenorhabditis brenneri]